MVRVHLIIDVVLSLTCTAAACVVLTDIHTPVRPILILVALVIGCGWAICGWLNLPDFGYSAALTIATGISLWIAISMGAVELKWWHPAVTVGVGLILATLSNIAQVPGDSLRRA